KRLTTSLEKGARTIVERTRSESLRWSSPERRRSAGFSMDLNLLRRTTARRARRFPPMAGKVNSARKPFPCEVSVSGVRSGLWRREHPVCAALDPPGAPAQRPGQLAVGVHREGSASSDDGDLPSAQVDDVVAFRMPSAPHR